MGASLSIGLTDFGPPTNRGVSIRKRVPIVGMCFRLFPFLEFCGPRFDRYSEAALAHGRSPRSATLKLCFSAEPSTGTRYLAVPASDPCQRLVPSSTPCRPVGPGMS
jgi:hypothetical protein